MTGLATTCQVALSFSGQTQVDTVAERVNTLATQIRQLRHRRDELTLHLATTPTGPDAKHLDEIRRQITTITDTGTARERKALCDATIAELRIHGTTGQLVLNIPTTTTKLPAINTKHAARTRVEGCSYAGTFGTPPGTRTPNPLVKSQLLCQLS